MQMDAWDNDTFQDPCPRFRRGGMTWSKLKMSRYINGTCHYPVASVL